MTANRKAIGFALAVIALVLYISPLAHALEGDESVSVTILYKDQKAQHGSMSVMQKSDEDSISQAVTQHGGKVERRFSSINAVSASLPGSQIAEIEKDPRVLAVERPTKVYALLRESVPLINANASWQKVLGGMNITGRGTSICVIDTGVDYTHPDLGGCFGAGCRIVAGYDFVNGDGNPMDDNGHGTHVVGIIAANGTSIKGVAPDAKIVAVKVLDANGRGDSSDVENGIDWCINNSAKYNITAISMSLGDNVSHTSFCDNAAGWVAMTDLINKAAENNISVVAATGNYRITYGYAGISAPACIRNAIRVTATDKSDAYAVFAQRSASFPDIFAAPGVSIFSTWRNGKYATLDGTSMATPHVSGAIALLSHAYRAENGVFPSPAFLGARLNATGKRIYDSATGMEFSRIDVLRALNSIIPPNIMQAYNNITKSSASRISLNESDAVFFNVSLDQNTTYSWYLNNMLMNSTASSFIWQTGHNDSGNWIVRVAASNGYLSGSFEWNATVFDVPLAIASFYPEKNFTAYENSKTALNITASRDTKKDTWLIDGVAVSSRGRNMSITWNCTSAGAHNITYIGEDDFDSVRVGWTANIIGINCPPYINPPLSSPVIFELQNQSAYDISGNVHDDDGDNLVISVDDKNITVSGFVLNFNYSVPVTNKTVTIFVNDSFSLVSQAINVTAADTTAPKISIVSPENKAYANREIGLDFSVDEAAAGCGYALNNVSHSIEECANTTITAHEGWNIVTLYANDTSGNSANSTVLFFVDSVPPEIYFSPPNSTKEDFMLFSASLSEIPSSCTLLLDGAEHRMEINSSICSLNLTGISPGQHNISIFANDSAGNRNITGNYSIGAYYCIESASAWSSCQSAKRYRARVLRDCGIIEESEPCTEPVSGASSGGGGGGGSSWQPDSAEMERKDNNTSTKAFAAVSDTGKGAQKNATEPQVSWPGSPSAQANASVQNAEINVSVAKKLAGSQNKTVPLQAVIPAGKAQAIVFNMLSAVIDAIRASSGEMHDTERINSAAETAESAGADSSLQESANFRITGAILYGDRLISLGDESPFQAALRASGRILLDPLGTALAGIRMIFP